jgi:hypothetical protein
MGARQFRQPLKAGSFLRLPLAVVLHCVSVARPALEGNRLGLHFCVAGLKLVFHLALAGQTVRK